MSALHELWKHKREWLKDDYSDDRGDVNCGLLAEEIAELLKKEGKTPLLLDIRGRIDGVDRYRRDLVPVPYKDKDPISWSGHCICLSEGLVYDPILEEPTPLGDYGTKAFGEEIEVVNIRKG